MNIDGRVRSLTAGMPVKLGKCKEHEFGDKFLDTFKLVLRRITGQDDALGDPVLLSARPDLKSKLLRYKPDWGGIDTINAVLFVCYSKMWDLDVKIAQLQEIPPDIIQDYRTICQAEFEGFEST